MTLWILIISATNLSPLIISSNQREPGVARALCTAKHWTLTTGITTPSPTWMSDPPPPHTDQHISPTPSTQDYALEVEKLILTGNIVGLIQPAKPYMVESLSTGTTPLRDTIKITSCPGQPGPTLVAVMTGWMWPMIMAVTAARPPSTGQLETVSMTDQCVHHHQTWSATNVEAPLCPPVSSPPLMWQSHPPAVIHIPSAGSRAVEDDDDDLAGANQDIIESSPGLSAKHFLWLRVSLILIVVMWQNWSQLSHVTIIKHSDMTTSSSPQSRKQRPTKTLSLITPLDLRT